LKTYKITYWGRRYDEGYDWVTVKVTSLSFEKALDKIKEQDVSFKSPFEIFKVEKLN
jgi:hypothetical protein